MISIYIYIHILYYSRAGDPKPTRRKGEKGEERKDTENRKTKKWIYVLCINIYIYIYIHIEILYIHTHTCVCIYIYSYIILSRAGEEIISI